MAGTIVLLRDLAAMGFCRDGAIKYAQAKSLDFFAVERGEVTSDYLRTLNDTMFNRLADAADRRAALAVAKIDCDVVVIPADLRKAGFCRDGLSSVALPLGLSWADLRHGRITVSQLRGLHVPEADGIADIAEARYLANREA